MTLSEVAARTGLTRAGARRILLTLAQLGYVTVEGRQFRLSARILDLGFAYLSSMPFWDLAEPIMEAIANAVLEPYAAAEQPPDRDWIDGIRLVCRSPALQGEYLRTQYATQQALAQAIAVRTGADPADMLPAILAGAVAAATQVAIDRWLHADPPAALAPLVRRALNLIPGPVAPRHAERELTCHRPPHLRS